MSNVRENSNGTAFHHKSNNKLNWRPDTAYVICDNLHIIDAYAGTGTNPPNP